MQNAHAAKMQARAVAEMAETQKCHADELAEIKATLAEILSILKDSPDKSDGGPLKNRVQNSK